MGEAGLSAEVIFAGTNLRWESGWFFAQKATVTLTFIHNGTMRPFTLSWITRSLELEVCTCRKHEEKQKRTKKKRRGKKATGQADRQDSQTEST